MRKICSFFRRPLVSISNRVTPITTRFESNPRYPSIWIIWKAQNARCLRRRKVSTFPFKCKVEESNENSPAGKRLSFANTRRQPDDRTFDKLLARTKCEKELFRTDVCIYEETAIYFFLFYYFFLFFKYFFPLGIPNATNVYDR